jgi:arylsulfatase A-like enzyme
VNPQAKNVLIVVFDALSAKNIALYGYQRDTMPNLSRMAERATVYHHHYSGGNFTTPGTSSLLTATYPWTHRAIGLGGVVIDALKHKSLFSSFHDYYRIAYSHNTIVNRLFKEFSEDISYLKPQRDLFLQNPLAFDRAFTGDEDIAEVAYERAVKKTEPEKPYSLFFSSLYDRISSARAKELSNLYPRGVPRTGEDNFFLLEHGIDWVMSQIPKIPRPFLGYFHFLPPHRPYCPREDYVSAFYNDGVGYIMEKPKSIFNHNASYNLTIEANERRRYDEYILYADAQLGRLYDDLQKSGALEDTWVIFTSDHGEMCERGITGHHTPVLYEPVIRIPLLILEPGQQKRRDVLTPTSAVDVIPTLLKVTGHPIPEGMEGEIMPPFAEGAASADRSIFTVEAKLSQDPLHKPLNPLSLMMVKGKYKVIRYAGYHELGNQGPVVEFYDLENDPEELTDLVASKPSIATALTDEMLGRLHEAERAYQGG